MSTVVTDAVAMQARREPEAATPRKILISRRGQFSDANRGAYNGNMLACYRPPRSETDGIVSLQQH